jgi:hypothetical protein
LFLTWSRYIILVGGRMNPTKTNLKLTRAGILGILMLVLRGFSFDVQLDSKGVPFGTVFEVLFIPNPPNSYPDCGDSVGAPSVVTFSGSGWNGRMIAKRPGFVSDTVDTVLYSSTSRQTVYFNLTQTPTSIKNKGVSVRVNLPQKTDSRRFNIAGRLLTKKINDIQIIIH